MRRGVVGVQVKLESTVIQAQTSSPPEGIERWEISHEIEGKLNFYFLF